MTFVPVIPESYSHVLAEFESLDPLLSALRLDSSRLKCTSVAVSRKWLALGSSGGGLNLIQKEGWKHRLFLSHREGAISQVACCLHDEDYVAVATGQGLVVIWELNQERRGKPERIYVSSEHKGRKVTALCWDTAILRVFVGDHMGKVSAIKLNTSKQVKAAAAFVMFPVQTITTVDSCVVQLDYLDGRLLISSITRSFLCDTEREKFWKIGSKERDGEYGACFFPGRCSAGQQPLIYCARPGSRMWEVNFDGEVISTHQFKKLLSSPPLPVITLRSEPQYDHTVGSSQSLAFPKLLHLSEHCVLTWTERGIYIFIPQNVQVLLWSEVKDIQDVAVFKNELFCLHLNGKVSHLSLLSVERCVERLLRKGLWNLAACTCCLFQNSIIASRGRKSLTVDKLEHLKSQLDLTTNSDLISQLEELILKFEPLDSACSSRRSSISSHESFSILDSGIYRVISSRRSSQSDEDSCSLHSQTLSEDERLKEFTSHPEEEQLDQCWSSHGNEGDNDSVSHAPVTLETDKNETFLPFSIPLPFRSPSPLVSLQAVKESVSSFVRKTTEKIGTLHTGPDLKIRPEPRGDEQLCEEDVSPVSWPKEEDTEGKKEVISQPPEEDKFQDLKVATAEAMTKLQDPLVLFEPKSLRMVLQEWLSQLEKTFAMKDFSGISDTGTSSMASNQDVQLFDESKKGVLDEDNEKEKRDSLGNEETVDQTACESTSSLREPLDDLFQVCSPCSIDNSLKKDLAELATLCLELNVLNSETKSTSGHVDHTLQLYSPEVLACQFIKKYFFVLDLKRAKESIKLSYINSPCVWDTFIEGLKEMASSSPAHMEIEEGDLPSRLKLVNDSVPFDSPLLIAYATRLYEKFGESALRSLIRFYPSILPSDVMQLCHHHPAEFLAYLDSLVKSRPEDQRPSFLESLLQPESLRLDWLLLAVSHDAPPSASTMDGEGNPRPHSHLFSWGYSQLVLHLIKLPADFTTKEKMADICRSHGFWPGYLTLCLELERRREAFTNIVCLNDMSLMEGDNGWIPETVEEWKLLLHLVQNKSMKPAPQKSPNGNFSDGPSPINVENVALLLAKSMGPDRAWSLLQECGLTLELSQRFTRTCDILRIAEKRQRALIQSMLEKCDRFLWSQQA
ncbi:Hermansky-Pudlak syndrome 5 protein isoform X1 [Suricata suricatta]|uniref:Hermansky-Pudlak syndrome 5 protein isoform X1 n=2 Tax=Suricata suricatta TaxID=37032 RepID=UPI001156B3D5|nr:Hermansky-Pudlak syndrome 5 protein isoform X1 [Suricata suricatta]XP_029771252.1 Hermansky-Pudlak syndrome 5 protein isoform X1 [Suricata suricatta]XP_029771253.1 Hermansky-Pudlak syndrome 5 protein isoform X1 [Suricata suricatta]XP_029771254.1 Hermansky-Pudlak syndrome 5 protein isoform X1 [Suricata suricatta]XP_029771255.1 Hermansky-Pudlak syndrome 5 protein isoform X1 [Suricata suricatta]XP_029771256.1 Hermansky-Pudlak syndrome 5 protein isoform X1 [Suricata suricatta]XP_029771257.1 He